MQASVESIETGALLFVHRAAALPSSIEAVNRLLSHRRACGSAGDALLGVVVRAGVDAGVMIRPLTSAGPANDAVKLRESVSLAGIWSLWWFEISSLNEIDRCERRKHLLDTLVRSDQADSDGPRGRPMFIPVLTARETTRGSAVLLDDLQERYPTLTIARECFVRDPALGMIVRPVGNRIRPRVPQIP